MSKIIDSVRLPYQATVVSDGAGTVSSDRVKTGQALVCQSIAFRNRTGDRGEAVLQIRQSGVTYPLEKEIAPAANEWYVYSVEQHILDGEQVEVSQADCIAADVLDMVIVGYVEYKKELK